MTLPSNKVNDGISFASPDQSAISRIRNALLPVSFQGLATVGFANADDLADMFRYEYGQRTASPGARPRCRLTRPVAPAAE